MTEEQRRWREQQVEKIGLCDICQGQATEVHEFARGTNNRQPALTEPCCQLVLCFNCHRGPKGIHSGGYSLAEQLAYLHWRGPDRYDIEKYYSIIARRHPSQEAVWQAYVRITTYERDDP